MTKVIISWIAQSRSVGIGNLEKKENSMNFIVLLGNVCERMAPIVKITTLYFNYGKEDFRQGRLKQEQKKI